METVDKMSIKPTRVQSTLRVRRVERLNDKLQRKSKRWEKGQTFSLFWKSNSTPLSDLSATPPRRFAAYKTKAIVRESRQLAGTRSYSLVACVQARLDHESHARAADPAGWSLVKRHQESESALNSVNFSFYV